MKRMILTAGAAAAALAASAVAVDYDAGNDAAIRFAANDLARILKDVPGKIVLTVDPAMPSQAWRIASRADGAVEIAGRDGMGISYGASTFLERHCGVAWLAPDTEIVPPLGGLRLQDLRLSETGRPAISYREMFTGSDGMDGDWRLRNKETRRASCGVGVHVGSPFDCHTFTYYNDALKKAHPEFYGKRRNLAGRICETFCMSDEATRDFVAERMCRYIADDEAKSAGKPAYMTPRFYDLSQQDGAGGYECGCPACRKLYDDAGGTSSGPNLAFVSAVAARVAKCYPDVEIQTFAYGPTEKPPTNDVRYADNVVVRYCRSWIFKPMLPTTENGQMLRDWSAHASKFGIWSYWRTYRGALFPCVVPPKTIEAELRFCRDCGVSRYFCENEAPLSRSFAMLQHWLFLKLTEDPDLDANALAKRFFLGYYGKAARPMAEYLKHLEGVQEESRAFLNRSFFEKVNALLDEAERLAAGDERSLRHVRWERIVVDRSMYDRLGALLKEGYSFDREAVARRFAANVKDQVENWGPFKYRHMQATRNERLLAAESEGELYSHFPVETPKRFAGLEVEDLHWNRCKGARSATVKDPDACAGVAFYNGQNDVHKLPYTLGFYHSKDRYGDSIYFNTREDVPQDEKFHLYRLGRAVVYGGLFLTYDSTWENRYYASTPGIVPAEWEIWVSMKFQGPNFVKGSTKENRVLFDRLLYVKNDDPMRGYKLAGGDLVRGFRPTSVTGPKEGFRHAYFKMPEVDAHTIQNDLLVTGRVKSAGIEVGKGAVLPFVGLWGLDEKGRNAMSIPCANIFPGSYDWRDFTCVVEASRIRKHAQKVKGPIDLTFRVNLANQTGTVEVDNIKVMPLAKADQ